MTERSLVPSLALSTVMLLVFSCTVSVLGKVYTSSYKVMNMVRQEETLLQDLHVDVLELGGGERLVEFSKFFVERMSLIEKREVEKEVEMISHPNGCYKCIKEFSEAYNKLREILDPSSSESLREHMDFFASEEDVKGARRSFIRLQDVYRLRAADMANGNYTGFLGPPLSCKDTYDIARTSMGESRYSFLRSLEWLNVTLDLLSNESSSPEEDPQERCPHESSVLGLKGRALFRLKRWEDAKEVYDKAVKQDNTDPEVVALEKDLTEKPKPFYRPYSIDTKVYSLCSQESKLTPDEFDPRLRCMYRPASLRPPYLRYKQELLSVSPYVALFYDVMSDVEGDVITSTVKDKLIRATTLQKKGRSIDEARTSDLHFLYDFESPAVAKIGQRISAITGLNTEQEWDNVHYAGEPLQILNYGLGGHYATHTDTFSEEQKHKLGATALENGNRIATFLIYLSDVDKGGATVFPFADRAVSPVKNMALFWYSLEPSGKLDKATDHSGCPVMVGHKWVANKWMWTYGNTFTRRCGLTKDATQLDIDRYMIHGWT
ncbi:prolyl 4-hydroxylase subunit alpha-2 [Aplysia californica]|uniref:procollagen-proline 4-dioxygenase n=1 Tax=Aplysia californica TaxID=6500 RepID=A0ABM1VQC9_APLCA|nr:prolyl 4-hydroxylase subunit alpha-2 [Aplysia californica]